MIHNHWLRITQHDSQQLSQHNTPASGCESWCVILSHWLWIMVNYSGLVSVNRGELCWARGCESWCAMLSKWLWISITHHDSQPLAQNSTPWFTTTRSFITYHDSQPLAQHNTPWFTCELWWVMLSQRLWIMVCYAEQVVVNHFGLCWASGSLVSYDEPVIARFTTTGSA
jgi:hypothetical protein